MISTVKDPLAPATGEFLLPLMYLERGQRRPVMFLQPTYGSYVSVQGSLTEKELAAIFYITAMFWNGYRMTFFVSVSPLLVFEDSVTEAAHVPIV